KLRFGFCVQIDQARMPPAIQWERKTRPAFAEPGVQAYQIYSRRILSAQQINTACADSQHSNEQQQRQPRSGLRQILIATRPRGLVRGRVLVLSGAGVGGWSSGAAGGLLARMALLTRGGSCSRGRRLRALLR